MTIHIKGDPSETEALFVYEFDDGEKRFSNFPPDAVLAGMKWYRNPRRVQKPSSVIVALASGLAEQKTKRMSVTR